MFGVRWGVVFGVMGCIEGDGGTRGVVDFDLDSRKVEKNRDGSMTRNSVMNCQYATRFLWFGL